MIPTIPAIDPNVIPSDLPRLEGQNAAILALLWRGPATNAEMASVALKYTSRVSDIRKAIASAGWDIVCARGERGLNTYKLVRVKVEQKTLF